ncbi:MAG: 2-dehydropantoate 2-reductase [Thermoplasmata archaeon]
MKILVVGAGAVGSLFGARLAGAGHSVQLIARPAHVAAIRSHGLRVEGVAPGTFRPDALSEIEDATPPDVLLLTVKTFDLGSVASAVARRLPKTIPTLLPQNGLRVEEGVTPAFRAGGWEDPTPWLVRAVNTVPAMWVEPGVVRQAGQGELVVPEPRVGGPSGSSVDTFRAAFAATGVAVRVVADLERELWRKALVNAAINPLTALHGVPNGALLRSPYVEPAHRLLREAQQAAAAAGFAFSDPEADADLDRVLGATAENRSSMLQDRERGRPTEIDAISGEIVRTAAAHGVDLPETRAVIERLRRADPTASGRAQPS